MQLKGKKIRRAVKVDHMEWNGSTTKRFVPRAESSFSFLYNNNNYYSSYPGMEVKQQALSMETPPAIEKLSYGGNQEKKKRLTSEQLDSLESSFQQEIKLDPDRKMKLSKELGLQPRQIAVWFQNRRARWKTKQLEHLYDTLKQEFDVIAKEKHKLEEEVMKLKGMLRDQQGCRTQQVSAGYTTEVSAEETVESTSGLALRCSKIHHHHHQQQQHQHQIHEQQNTANADQGNCSLTHMAEDCSTVPVMSYWPGLPYYP